jgi:hypothetical protein
VLWVKWFLTRSSVLCLHCQHKKRRLKPWLDAELFIFALLSLQIQILVPKYFQCMGQFPGTLGDTFLVSLLSGHAD